MRQQQDLPGCTGASWNRPPATELGRLLSSLRNGGRKAQPAVPSGTVACARSARPSSGGRQVHSGWNRIGSKGPRTALRRGGLGRLLQHLPRFQPRCPSARHRGRIADVRRRVSGTRQRPRRRHGHPDRPRVRRRRGPSTSTSSHAVLVRRRHPNDIDSPGSSPDLDCMTGTAGTCTVSYVAANSGTDICAPIGGNQSQCSEASVLPSSTIASMSSSTPRALRRPRRQRLHRRLNRP